MRPVRAFALVPAILLLAAAAPALLAPGAGGASGLGFTSFPKRTLAGGSATVVVRVPRANDRCTLGVAYPNGTIQRGLRTLVSRTLPLTWTWTVPPATKTGTAHVSVACRSSGRISRSLVVVGKVLPPKIDVVKQGFSVRARFGQSSISYGVVLANRSQTDDALDVHVLVNFVNPSNGLVGTSTTTLKSIAAGSEYALGKSASVDGTVSRLEVVVQVGNKQPAIKAPVPTVLNGAITPGVSDAKWVGAVKGELTNVSKSLILRSAGISAVVLNSAGEVVGGGSGSVYGTLPPGAREFVELTFGLDSVLVSDAVTVQFSVDPSYVSDDSA